MNRFAVLIAAFAVSLSAGCVSLLGDTADEETTTRSQAADEPTDPDAVPTVGEKTVVGNVESIPVTGIGLVYNLDGTGSSPPPGEMRAVLENQILKRKGRPKELLDDTSRSTSLVLVTAVIPPGSRTGDAVDVTVSLPPGSKTTSLKGGVLFPCELSNHEYVGNVRESMSQAGMPSGNVPVSNSQVLTGNKMAVAQGPLIAGTVRERNTPIDESGAGDEPVQLRAGKLWGGARVLADRPYYILLDNAAPQPRLAMVVAERLNTVFHALGDPSRKIADAKVQGQPMVVTIVPPAYRMNHARFLLVARQVPLVPIGLDHPYRRKLEHDLVLPEAALTAAIKLEALGPDSRQALRVGLQSDSPWVRFASAEALAYLGHPDGATDLGELAAAHPSIRSHCLTALASLDDAVSTDQLATLMTDPDPELRYGAFVALRMADPTHEAVRGVRVKGSFWMHKAAPDSPALVHVAAQRKSEIVLFGTGHPLRTPFSFPLGADFTVTAGADDAEITVTRIVTKDGEPTAVAEKCPADLGAVMMTLAKLGGSYSEAVELVLKSQKAQVLAAELAIDTIPRGVPIQQLAVISRNDPELAKADRAVEQVMSGGIVQAGYDLPTEADAVKQPEPVVVPAPAPLNRNPGRLFGTREDVDEAEEVPAAFNREPGRLFGK